MSVCDDGWDIFRAGGLIDRRMRGVLTLILGPLGHGYLGHQGGESVVSHRRKIISPAAVNKHYRYVSGVPTISAAGGLMDDWLS